MVNNLGVVGAEHLEQIHTDTLDADLSLNLLLPCWLFEPYCPRFRAKHWGRIVSTSSLTILSAAERTSYLCREGRGSCVS